MSTVKTLLKRADELAQNLSNAWNASSAALTPESRALLRLAFLYKTAREIAENQRALNILSDSDEAKETAIRLIFVGAYKIYRARQAVDLTRR